MNVTPEADAAFMRELQREDSQRYDRLMKNIQTGAIRSNRDVTDNLIHIGCHLALGKRESLALAMNTSQKQTPMRWLMLSVFFAACGGLLGPRTGAGTLYRLLS